jgi:hypothetical protein
MFEEGLASVGFWLDIILAWMLKHWIISLVGITILAILFNRYFMPRRCVLGMPPEYWESVGRVKK